MARIHAIQLKLTEEEHEHFKAQAEKYGMNLCAWIRRRCAGHGRLRPPRKPVSPRCMHGLIASRVCGECEDIRAAEEREQARLKEQNAKAAAESQRRYEAERQARKAGSVLAWYRGMTPAERQEWRDLEDELLQSERLRQEAEATWTKFSGQSPEAYEIPRPQWRPAGSAAAAWRPPAEPTGIIEIDYPPDPPSLNLKGTITHVDRLKRPQEPPGVGDMPGGF
jgi:hypothetical protein